MILKKIIEEIKLPSITGAVILSLGWGLYTVANKSVSYQELVNPMCKEVMSNFDKNKNGGLDFEEGVNLARKVGYQETFPGTDLMFSLEPGNWMDKNAILKVYSSGTNIKINGLFVEGNGSPSTNIIYSLPLDTLKEIVKGQTISS